MTSCKNMLKIVSKNSLEIYSLIKTKPTMKKELYKYILEKNKTELLKMIPTISKKTQLKLENNYKKEKCLDDILYYYDYFKHLKNIRDIVNLEDIINKLIPDKLYYKKLNLYYTDLILDSLINVFYDYDNLKILSKLKEEVLFKNKDVDEKIIINIKRFYIKRITI